MENRLSRITTRSGDDGSTGLADGSRLRKDEARIVAIGDVDELNSQLGVLLCEPLPDELRALLVEVQHALFDLGGQLAMPGTAVLQPAALELLDEAVERHNAALPALREFVLPGGSRSAALAHVARTVARRAERGVVALGSEALPQRYLNRLSDLLFVVARVLNRANLDGLAGDDVHWRSRRLSQTPSPD